ncbi:MAG: LptE family protein [Acidobacteria bacterium]|nr:LptE family protein [Acidobacteriota bacterium]
MKRVLTFISVFVLLLGFIACGYHLVGRGSYLPSHIKKIAIPTFKNNTSRPGLEEVITEKVQEEFLSRGSYRILPAREGADAELIGELVSYQLRPGALDEEGRATSYTVTVRAKVVFTDLVTGKVLFTNDHLTFSENFQVSEEVGDYYNQEEEAIKISAERFAKRLAALILESF